MSKTGRPKSQNPHNIRYNIRLDQQTEDKLTDYCQRHNLRKTTAIRLALIAMLDDEKQKKE